MVVSKTKKKKGETNINQTKIDYLTHTWNPFVGCQQPASVCAVHDHCWARSMAWRFGKTSSERHFAPIFYPLRLHEPSKHKKPARIGVSFMGDLFSVPPEVSHLAEILTEVQACPQHTFVFLTKSPQNLVPIEWPDNAWVGTSVTDNATFIGEMAGVQARVKFLSIEPLLTWKEDDWHRDGLPEAFTKLGINWVIVGAQTRPTILPKLEWIRDIERATDRAGVPLFEKDNLKPLLGDNLRQEYPC